MTLLVLLKQRLRRDRWQLPIWILGVGALALVAAVGVAQTYGDAAERQSTILLSMANPAILLLRGLPNGSDLDAFVFFQIFTYLALCAGFMSTFLAVRHSRAEEETGRAELIGSTPASRTLPMVATVIHGVLANLAVGVLVALGFIGGGLGVTGSWVTGAATAAVGISFLGIGLLVSQFARSARGANGASAAILGVAFLLRGIGDALGTPSKDAQSMTSAWPSWLSPISWAQHTAAFSQNDLTPLLLNLALAVVCVVVVFTLQTQRDSGASLLAGRSARPDAPASLSGSFGLAWRLQWPVIVGWSLGGVACGLLAGGLSKVVAQLTTANPIIAQTLQALSPGQKDSLTSTTLWALFGFAGVLAAACAMQTVVRMRQEETTGTAETLLATPLSRLRWLIDYLWLGVVAIAIVLLAAAVASGLAVLGSGGHWSTVGESFQAAAGQIPAALVYLAVMALIFVLVPAITVPLGWSLLAIGLVLGMFGSLIGIPDWLKNVSPFAHTPTPSVDGTDWSGAILMVGVAIVAGILSVAFVRRRELRT